MSSYCECGYAGTGKACLLVAVRTSFPAGICGDWGGEKARVALDEVAWKLDCYDSLPAEE